MSHLTKPISDMTIAELHAAAMEAYDRASTVAETGDDTGAVAEFRVALRWESEAAKRLAPRIDFEPTRSVIHRGAAVMALRCREYREAERLVATALSGNPHPEIADELRDLLEQIHFERHLGLRGLRLAKNEFQVSITGNAVGFGIAESEEFVGRVQVSEKIVTRTIERKYGRPFRETGRAIREIATNYPLYLSLPRGGSFAVTLRVGIPQDQMFLEGMADAVPPTAEETIADIMNCLQAFNAANNERLAELIPDPAYRRNFTALARRLAPDGDRVKMVGLTAGDGEAVTRVAIDRPKREVDLGAAVPTMEGGRIEVTGRLLFANSTTRSNSIKVVDDQDAKHSFHVPEGMMADIVKPLWEDRVRVLGIRKGKRKVELLSIDPIREVPTERTRPKTPDATGSGPP